MKTEMTCRDGMPVLLDYLEGRLGARVRAAVDRHVAGCRRCQGFVASYVETPRIVRVATREPMPRRVGRDLRRRLALEVRERPARSRPGAGRKPSRKR